MDGIDSLAKIKVLIDKFYEDIGRDQIEDIEGARVELIERIEKIINSLEIPLTIIIPYKMEIEKEQKEKGDSFWEE